MNRLLWSVVAWFVSREWVVTRIMRVAHRRPYRHITSADGEDVYMYRFWLFNPYPENSSGQNKRGIWEFLPSIRLHHIMRPDSDRHLHDHPWNARTIILRGWYDEIRESGTYYGDFFPLHVDGGWMFYRSKGDTASLRFNEFHRIARVSDGGVVTLFFTWRYHGTWGFKVDGVKVPWRTYLGVKE